MQKTRDRERGKRKKKNKRNKKNNSTEIRSLVDEVKKALQALLWISTGREEIVEVKEEKVEQAETDSESKASGKEEEEEGVTDSSESLKEKEEQEQVEEQVEEVLEQMRDLQQSLEQVMVQLPPRPSEVCECHGLLRCPHLSGINAVERECGVCLQAYVPGGPRAFHGQNCQLFMCDACLQDQLSFMVSNGQVSRIVCPSCSYYLLPTTVARHLETQDCEKYHRFLLQKLLGHLPNVHECGNPGCENAVMYDEECALEGWTCEACAKTCPWCKEPAHQGRRKCAAHRKFLRAEAQHKAWVLFSVSKRCPQCRTPIIKNKGCHHMTCRNPECNHEFCWHCKKKWSEHGTCVFTKVLIGCAIAVTPVVVPLVVAAALVVAAPFAAAGGISGNVALRGRSILRTGWKLGRKILRKL